MGMEMAKLSDYIKLGRPHHYVKNGFIWLPLFFGLKLTDLQAVLHTFWAFLAFSLTASAVYVLNDLIDVQADRQHPVKKRRPIASGTVTAGHGFFILMTYFVLALVTSLLFLPQQLFYVLLVYLFLNLAYSFSLKHFAVVDVVCIAIGFILRIYAGGIAAEVYVSHWLVLMVFLLAIFLALAKRRDDLLLTSSGHKTRRSLDGYNLEFVNYAMVVMTSVVIVCYVLYTVSPEVIDKHGTDQLYLTTLWVIVGLLRYMQITFVEQKSGSPTRIVFKDYFLQAVILAWIIHIYFILYVN